MLNRVNNTYRGLVIIAIVWQQTKEHNLKSVVIREAICVYLGLARAGKADPANSMHPKTVNAYLELNLGQASLKVLSIINTFNPCNNPVRQVIIPILQMRNCGRES